jgi:hypothetical protein
MGVEDDFDYSYYRNPASYRTVRRERSTPREASPLKPLERPRVRRSAGEPIPAGQIKTAIKQLLVRDPALSVDQIFERLNFGVTVSRTTVSGIMTEFRHSLRFIRQAGLLK